MDDWEEAARKWGLGVALPVALTCLALWWGLSGHVEIRGRGGFGVTVFDGWAAWAVAGLPGCVGLWLHAEHFWTRHPSLAAVAEIPARVALLAGIAAGVATIAAVLTQFRP